MTWTPNLALHRKIAARVASSADGMQQADAASEVQQVIGAPRLILYRDTEASATLTWAEPLANNGETLGTPSGSPSGSVADADIDSGTWTARIESADGTYALTTTAVGKEDIAPEITGTPQVGETLTVSDGAGPFDVLVADDIDSDNGISVSITLAMDDDLSSGGSVEPPLPSGPLIYFPYRTDSPWNTKIPPTAIWRGPSDPRTETIRRNYGGGSHYDGDPASFQWAMNLWDYTIATWYASNSDPWVTINQGGQSWQVRCPANAVPSSGTDMHMCIIDPDGLHSHDMWGAQRSGNTINAWSYVKTRLDGMGWRMVEEHLESPSNPRGLNTANASAGGGGPRAASAGSLGGLIRKADLDAGVIAHALVFACPRRWANGEFGGRVYPANWISQGDGDSSSGTWEPFSGAIRYSHRFGLDKNVDVNSLGLSPHWTMIAKALQDYGMYMGDVAGENNPCLYAEWPAIRNAYGDGLKNQQSQGFAAIIPHMMALDWYP